MKTYLFSYWYAGKRWSLEIVANSLEEAKERLQAMSESVYDGVLDLEIEEISKN